MSNPKVVGVIVPFLVVRVSEALYVSSLLTQEASTLETKEVGFGPIPAVVFCQFNPCTLVEGL